MKRKITVSFIVMALVCALVGGATFALFTDSATNSNNTFSAGTLDVNVGAQTYEVDVTNLAPGDVVDGSFVVTNAGSLDLWYKLTAAGSGALFEGATPCTISITNPTEVYNALASGANATVNYTINFPLAANNDYQEATGTVTFTVNAEQVANNPTPSF